jgi:hypothetical protein
MNDEEKEIKKEGNWFTQQSTPVKAIIGLVGICCIGVILIFAMGAMSPDGINTSFNFTDFSGNTTGWSTERVGAHSFKIPAGYEEYSSTSGVSGGKIVTFSHKNDNEKTLVISDLNQQLDLDDFAVQYGLKISNDGRKTTINGEPAYRFETTSNGYEFYSYIINIDGDTYNFIITTDTSNPDKFIESLF